MQAVLLCLAVVLASQGAVKVTGVERARKFSAHGPSIPLVLGLGAHAACCHARVDPTARGETQGYAATMPSPSEQPWVSRNLIE